MKKKIIKWPKWIMLIRHDVSAYNVLKGVKEKDPLFQQFKKAWERDPESDRTASLAREVNKKILRGMGDASTPLADVEARRAREVGKALSKGELPDVIFVSPYIRTKLTLAGLVKGWPDLAHVLTYEEERIREQEHGMALLYNDWRVFQALHPKQRKLRQLEGPYWYRYPQGENVPDVRDRNRSWTTTLTRDFAGKRVLAVTHHLNILATRANFERLDAEHFTDLDEHDKPINCGVTLYRCDPKQGANGRLVLEYYNRRLYR